MEPSREGEKRVGRDLAPRFKSIVMVNHPSTIPTMLPCTHQPMGYYHASRGLDLIVELGQGAVLLGAFLTVSYKGIVLHI